MIYFKNIIIINLLQQVDPENFPKISPYSRPLPIHLTPKLSYYVPLPPPKKKLKKIAKNKNQKYNQTFSKIRKSYFSDMCNFVLITMYSLYLTYKKN